MNKPTPIEKVGSQDSVLSSIGAFITGELPAHDSTCRGNSNMQRMPILVLEPSLSQRIACRRLCTVSLSCESRRLIQGMPMRQTSVIASRDRIG